MCPKVQDKSIEWAASSNKSQKEKKEGEKVKVQKRDDRSDEEMNKEWKQPQMNKFRGEATTQERKSISKKMLLTCSTG